MTMRRRGRRKRLGGITYNYDKNGSLSSTTTKQGKRQTTTHSNKTGKTTITTKLLDGWVDVQTSGEKRKPGRPRKKAESTGIFAAVIGLVLVWIAHRFL